MQSISELTWPKGEGRLAAEQHKTVDSAARNLSSRSFTAPSRVSVALSSCAQRPQAQTRTPNMCTIGRCGSSGSPCQARHCAIGRDNTPVGGRSVAFRGACTWRDCLAHNALLVTSSKNSAGGFQKMKQVAGHSSASSFCCEIRLRSFRAFRFLVNKYLEGESHITPRKTWLVA